MTTRGIKSPRDIADVVFRGTNAVIREGIMENEKRAERFQEPLPLPKLDVAKLIDNVRKVTRETFTPQFRHWADEHPWDGKSTPEAWEEMAIEWLRDYYLIQIAHNDADLFRQLCEVWPEMTPPPPLTQEQLAELAELQKQANDILERSAAFMGARVAEMEQLAEREAAIVKGTRTPNDRRIANLTKWLAIKAPVGYQQKDVVGWDK